jgi:hypothetical protein
MNPEYIYMNVIAPSFILVPLITGLICYKKLPPEARVLLFYLLFDTIVNTASSWLAYHEKTNLPLYHIATILDTALLLYFFLLVLRSTRYTPFIKTMLLLFPVLGVVNILFFQPLHTFNSYTLSLKALLIIALCFLYWWQQENPDSNSWSAQPLNWIMSGLLLYFSSAFILFTFSNVIITAFSRSISLLIWNIHVSLSIVMYLLLARGFSKYRLAHE